MAREREEGVRKGKRERISQWLREGETECSRKMDGERERQTDRQTE